MSEICRVEEGIKKLQLAVNSQLQAYKKEIENLKQELANKEKQIEELKNERNGETENKKKIIDKYINHNTRLKMKNNELITKNLQLHLKYNNLKKKQSNNSSTASTITSESNALHNRSTSPSKSQSNSSNRSSNRTPSINASSASISHSNSSKHRAQNSPSTKNRSSKGARSSKRNNTESAPQRQLPAKRRINDGNDQSPPKKKQKTIALPTAFTLNDINGTPLETVYGNVDHPKSWIHPIETSPPPLSPDMSTSSLTHTQSRFMLSIICRYSQFVSILIFSLIQTEK